MINNCLDNVSHLGDGAGDMRALIARAATMAQVQTHVEKAIAAAAARLQPPDDTAMANLHSGPGGEHGPRNNNLPPWGRALRSSSNSWRSALGAKLRDTPAMRHGARSAPRSENHQLCKLRHIIGPTSGGRTRHAGSASGTSLRPPFATAVGAA